MHESFTPKGSESVWTLLLRRPLPLQRESALFLLVSALDVFMTYLLLRTSAEDMGGPRFYESNPVPGYFLDSWGLRGVICFKFAMVAVVEVIAQIVALKQVETARRLLEFGTLIVGGVVVYSLMLSLRHMG